MFIERLRAILAWPFLVIGGSFFLAGAKIGGAGVRFAVVDTLNQVIEEGDEKEKVEIVKRQRVYRPVPEAQGDGLASSTANLEAEFAAFIAAEEAQHSEITAF